MYVYKIIHKTQINDTLLSIHHVSDTSEHQTVVLELYNDMIGFRRQQHSKIREKFHENADTERIVYKQSISLDFGYFYAR